MADISLLEFIVYGLVCYTGIIMLIISAFRESPSTVSQSMVRVIWLIPSIICAFLLASAGQTITLYDIVIETDDGTAGSHAGLTVTGHEHHSITLLAPVWVTLHFLFFIVMLLYVIINVLMLFIKRD
uniref:ORF40 n=1 Tax=Nitrosopumilaceae spindle-shaped virus TaxID=3065433 RepID=A0AAT9J7D1_9VIRU